ncbi:unnamed protein product [Darwinula stevensoni]|uniref:Scavenger receptor class B member 1 n=1 Tax=Darwinula stevensoni TaxID=69355 RepID=A0A7R8XEB4_9CRUS|nr:unnamed protein product [Darwinula stevensoni]CAG0887642.1 unnamed protein product [Darwinula stevensoni]
MKKKIVCASCVGAMGLLLLTGGLLVVIFFSDLVTKVIHRELAFRNGSESFENWRAPPVEPVNSVYFFNVTNGEAVMANGSMPILQEVGPYVYRQTLEKYVVSWHNNNTLTYQPGSNMSFAPELSSGSEDDVIVSLNVPMMSAVYRMQHGSRIMRLALSSMFTKILKVKPLMNYTVRDLIWGYEDPLIKLAKDIMPPGESPDLEKFGYFVTRLGRQKVNMTVYTGVDNIYKRATYDNVNGARDIPFWREEGSCKAFRGTDGSVFSPDFTQSDTVWIYLSDMCRSLPLVFEKEIEREGVSTFRFTPPESAFGDPDTYPENRCYCLTSPKCPPKGVFNISVCQFGSPVMLSWPHFYMGDPRLREVVKGLSPDKEKHQFYFDINPKLGVAMQVMARFQINLATVGLWDIEPTRYMPNITFPVLWMQTGIQKLPDHLLDVVHQAVHTPEIAEAAMSYGLFILGAVLIFAMGAYVIKRKLTIWKKTRAVSPTKAEMNGKSETNGHSTDLPETIVKNGKKVAENGSKDVAV